MIETDVDLSRPCQRCHDTEAVASIDVVLGGPPIRETGELCGLCVQAVLGTPQRPSDPVGDLRHLDPEKRLPEIEVTRRRVGERLDELRCSTVRELHRRGWSWRQIGDAGGVTRARAQQLANGR